ncbi:YheC/YheD family protein [Paenibacillus sp. NPDC056579]|uniref:YheC/YheD family endospore coat-associated protein n=1 Tax=Paenibacillus sp. NPDC056579 TaxID=3345871 RepID=UPI00369DE129
MAPTSRHALGIMTTHTEGNPPFYNRDFYRKLCLIGAKSGFTVFVFTPQGIRWAEGTVTGFVYDKNTRRWRPHECPMPSVVYDRCFFTNRGQYVEYRETVRRLQLFPSIHFLGRGLKGKWEVQQMLEKDGRFDMHLPKTEVMRSVRSAAEWLQEHGTVLMKPQAGSQGRGVLLVQRTAASATTARLHAADSVAPESAETAPTAFTVRGRDARNRRIKRSFADKAELLRWLRRFTAKRDYLLQQYLQLHGSSGEAFDVRSLVQKDGNGRWQMTGMAVRKGQSGSLTSNLHGGGQVEPAFAYIEGQFGTEKAKIIREQLERLSMQIPEALEQCHGRLAELGIDFGVDTDGQIWILEVNSKPGRAIFAHLNDDAARNKALANPVLYARYLIRSRETLNPARSLKNTPRPAKSQ